jgi:putative endonuclease
MYYLYILKCKDESLYTGIALDVEKRFAEHVAGTGAKYTRAKGVKELVYTEECGDDRGSALKREYVVKHMTRAQKLELIL